MMRVLRVLMMVTGLVIAAASLTALWFAMRVVMGVGGVCAQGAAYEIETQCPQGTAGIMALSVPIGLVGLALYAFGNRHLPGPDLLPLAWPAAFLSLAYNFLDGAVQSSDGPFGGNALVGISCGVLFVVIGAAPLLKLRNRAWRRSVFWAHSPTSGTYARWGIPSRSRIALDHLREAEADNDVTVGERANVRKELQQAIAEQRDIEAMPSDAQASVPLALLQVVAIVAGIVVGTWLSTALLA